jgi:hypothetical protein
MMAIQTENAMQLLPIRKSSATAELLGYAPNLLDVQYFGAGGLAEHLERAVISHCVTQSVIH